MQFEVKEEQLQSAIKRAKKHRKALLESKDGTDLILKYNKKTETITLKFCR